MSRSAPPENSAPAPTSGLAFSTGSLMVGRLVVAALSWSGTVLVARTLGQEGFGQFTLVFGLLGMLSIVTDLGLGRVAVAGYAAAGADRATYAGSYILLRCVLGVVGYLAAVGWAVVAGYPDRVVAATAVAGLMIVFATPASAYDIAFQIRNRIPLLAVAGVVAQLAQVALTVALVLRGGTLVWFVVPAVLNDLLILLWKAPASHRLIEIVYRLDLRVWGRLLRESAPLTLGAAFATLYYRVDMLMLASLDSFTSVGLYGVARKFVDLLHFAPTALVVALMAPLSTSWLDDRERFATHLRDGAQLLLVVATAALVGTWIFAGDLAAAFYGGEYREAGGAMRLLITAESVGFLSALATTALLAATSLGRYPLITFAGLALNIAVNAVAIPRWSYDGAAATTLLTEALVAALLLRLLATSGVGRGAAPTRAFTGGLVATAALSAAVGLGLRTIAPWPVAAVACGVVFVAATVGIGLLGRSRLPTPWSAT